MEKKSAKTPAKCTTEVAEPPFDSYAAVIDKYKSEGWVVFRTPGTGGNVDIMARKDEGVQKTVKTKFHFVQVITPETVNDIKFRGESKNSFVQNAFSNGAEPIHAFVTRSRTKNTDAKEGEPKWTQKTRITFRNVNSDSVVRV